MELEKILEETEQLVNMHYEDDSVKTIIMRNMREIRKHMNDGWISVEERLPEVDEDTEETIEDDDCPEYIVTIRGASESTTLKYNPDGTWFDENGCIYDVIAWRPLPEPYRPERSEE